MKHARHIALGCGLLLIPIVLMFAIGVFVTWRSFVENLPFLQTEASRAQQHVQAIQILNDSQAQQPWTPFVTAARELGIIALWLLPVCLFGAICLRGATVARWVWPRDGMWPMTPKEVRRRQDIAINAVVTRNLAEVEHAKKANAPVHMHVTGKPTKDTEADLPETPNPIAPSFADLGEQGLFDGDD